MRIGHMLELKSEFWQEKAKSKTEALKTGLHGFGPAIRMYPTWYPKCCCLLNAREPEALPDLKARIY
jgi:hypothetical protein